MDKPITKIVAGGIIFANAVGLAGEVMAVSNYPDTDYERLENQASIVSTATASFEASTVHGASFTTVVLEPLKASVFQMAEWTPPEPKDKRRSG